MKPWYHPDTLANSDIWPVFQNGIVHSDASYMTDGMNANDTDLDFKCDVQSLHHRNNSR